LYYTDYVFVYILDTEILIQRNIKRMAEAINYHLLDQTSGWLSNTAADETVAYNPADHYNALGLRILEVRDTLPARTVNGCGIQQEYVVDGVIYANPRDIVDPAARTMIIEYLEEVRMTNEKIRRTPVARIVTTLRTATLAVMNALLR
jgi:hypothetical protein